MTFMKMLMKTIIKEQKLIQTYYNIGIYIGVQKSLQDIFIKKVQKPSIRNFYKNYLIETEDFAKYMIKKCNVTNLSDIKRKDYFNIDKYLKLVSRCSVFKEKDLQSVKTVILKMLA